LREPRTRRRSRGADGLDDVNIDNLFGNDDDDMSSLESVFKRKTNNPFDQSSVFAKALEETEQEELAKKDTNVVYSTGYSIHLLTPYVLMCIALCFGFIIVDNYFFNIVEYLSQDIRYKLPFYGTLTLVVLVLTWFFTKKCFDYINFVMFMTKYKVVYGLKFIKKKQELTLFSVAETLNKSGMFGYFLNYGNLTFYTTARRKYTFDRIHGARYIFEIIQELKYGKSRGLLQNETIENILSGGNGSNEEEESEVEEGSSKKKKSSGSLDMNDLTSLGFTEEELREFGMLPKPKKQKENAEEGEAEADVIDADAAEVSVDDSGSGRRRRSRRK
jgi:hypothetical protein